MVREVQRGVLGHVRASLEAVRQSGSRLSGSIKLSRPSGTYPVTGTLRGTAIKFGAVGAGATYTGAVHGDSMSGRYKTGQGGGSWSAHKAS
jgi:hypothetical protein